VQEKHARQQQAKEKRWEIITDALTEHGVGETEAVRVLAGKGRDDREVWIAPGSGESFRDADFAPEMVVVPAGSFMMGSPESEEGRDDDEGPQHAVTIPQPFAVGKYPVTFAEWDAYVALASSSGLFGIGGNKLHKPDDKGWGRGNRPVINVSWDDAQAYVKWLSEKTGKTYRLLSEAEWEYVARAGTQTRYFFGNDESTLGAHGWYEANSFDRTQPVGEKNPNAWGLHDVFGNVWERVEDCWNESYADKPDRLKASGGAWTSGDCDRRVLRGGSWIDHPQYLRSASRFRSNRDYRYNYRFGFRLARTLTP